MLCPVGGLAHDTSVRLSVVARVAVLVVDIITVAFGDTTIALRKAIRLVTRCAVLLRLCRRLELVVFVSIIARHQGRPFIMSEIYIMSDIGFDE